VLTLQCFISLGPVSIQYKNSLRVVRDMLQLLGDRIAALALMRAGAVVPSGSMADIIVADNQMNNLSY
jgi:hypothetical protein